MPLSDWHIQGNGSVDIATSSPISGNGSIRFNMGVNTNASLVHKQHKFTCPSIGSMQTLFKITSFSGSTNANIAFGFFSNYIGVEPVQNIEATKTGSNKYFLEVIRGTQSSPTYGNQIRIARGSFLAPSSTIITTMTLTGGATIDIGVVYAIEFDVRPDWANGITQITIKFGPENDVANPFQVFTDSATIIEPISSNTILGGHGRGLYAVAGTGHSVVIMFDKTRYKFPWTV